MSGVKKQDWSRMVKAAVVCGIILLPLGLMLHLSNVWRAEHGWFTAGAYITLNNFSYVCFFAVFTATALAVIVTFITKVINGGKKG